MLGKVEIDPLDRIEIQGLLSSIENALDLWNATEEAYGEGNVKPHEVSKYNLSSSEMKDKEDAVGSLEILKKFLLG